MIEALKDTEVREMLSRNYIARIGYISKKTPHIIPITYHFVSKSNFLISYSGKGKKIQAMRKAPRVCVEIEEIENVNSWRTVVAHGVFQELSGADAKYFLHEFAIGVARNIKKKKEVESHLISEFSKPATESQNPIVYGIKLLRMTGMAMYEKHNSL